MLCLFHSWSLSPTHRYSSSRTPLSPSLLVKKDCHYSSSHYFFSFLDAIPHEKAPFQSRSFAMFDISIDRSIITACTLAMLGALKSLMAKSDPAKGDVTSPPIWFHYYFSHLIFLSCVGRFTYSLTIGALFMVVVGGVASFISWFIAYLLSENQLVGEAPSGAAGS